MKKPKIVNKKWLVILLIAVVLITFSFLDEQRSIAARTIVLALSLDKQDNEYELAIQVLKTDKSEKQEFLTYSAKGDKVSTLIDKLSCDTGGTVALCHALVLILSPEILDNDRDSAMRYFLESEVLCNNTMVVASTQSPREALSPTLANGVGSGYYIGQILRNMDSELGIIPVTLKDYFKNRSRIGKCVYLPCVSVIDDGGTKYVDITQSYVSDGTKGVLLSEKATKGMSLVLNSINNGTLPYEYESTTGEMDIVRSSSDIKMKKEGTEAKLEIKTTLKDNAYVPEKINEDRCKEYIISEINGYVLECYKKCKEAGLDVFFIGQRSYAYQNPLYKEDNYLEKVDLKIDVKISMK